MINESCHAYEWVMSHIRMSHVAHMKEPCHTYDSASFLFGGYCGLIWMRHVTHTNEACHTHEWGMCKRVCTRTYTCIRTYTNEACHTHEWGMSHAWMRHVTHMNENITHTNEVSHAHDWAISHVALWMMANLQRNSTTTKFFAQRYIVVWVLKKMIRFRRKTLTFTLGCRVYMCVSIYLSVRIYTYIYMWVQKMNLPLK